MEKESQRCTFTPNALRDVYRHPKGINYYGHLSPWSAPEGPLVMSRVWSTYRLLNKSRITLSLKDRTSPLLLGVLISSVKKILSGQMLPISFSSIPVVIRPHSSIVSMGLLISVTGHLLSSTRNSLKDGCFQAYLPPTFFFHIF